ncbi:hypothetical protein DXG01_012270 [Tephrocybe rancida]|nr:hypothetical protein DXG01_012270 [Tephrocybe rancida]
MVRRDSKEHPSHAGGKGKQPKRFLNKDAALDLAAAIAGVQEEKTLSRAERNHQTQARQPQKSDQKPRISASKVKLKETKALLAAQRTHSKRKKVKRRKEREQISDQAVDESAPVASKTQARRRVSFA